MTLTLTLTDAQYAGLTRHATALQFDSPDALALRLVGDAAAQGCAVIKAEADAAWLAKQKIYEAADPKATKEQIEAAVAVAAVEVAEIVKDDIL